MKLFIYISTILSVFFMSVFANEDFMNKKVNIIFLNGVGSVGKTSIAKAFQDISSSPYLHIGIDHFIVMLPNNYLPGGNKASEGIDFITEQSKNGPITKVHCGDIGKKLFNSMRKAMVALAKDGFNLIIDEVILGDEFEEYKKLFKDYNFISVGVFAPLKVIEEREKHRKDRTWGLARWQYDIVHKNKHYDLEIDTSKSTPEQSAKQINNLLMKRYEKD